MHLLLVDDDVYAVERVRNMLDWKELGINSVSVAYSVAQAIEVFCAGPVDILLSDVEMPQKNGIDLAAWVREQGYNTAIVFLTCHAQFTYAKDALRLKSQDYLLKPVDAETLRSVLSRTVTHIKREERIQKLTKSESLWIKNRDNILEYFWLQVAQGRFSCGEREIILNANERGIQLSKDTKLHAVLVSLVKYDENWTEGDRKLITYALMNIARELFERKNSLNAVMEIVKGKLLLVYGPAGDDTVSEVKDQVAYYMDVCKRYLGLNITCGISSLCSPEELSIMVERMMEWPAYHRAGEGAIWEIDLGDAAPEKGAVADTMAWSDMMERGLYQQVRMGLISFFQDPATEEHLSSYFLKSFQRDFLQLIYEHCHANGLSRAFLKENVTLQERASQSVPDMLIWANTIIDQLERMAETREDADPVVETKKFIAENLDQDISRTSIAEHVHLNEDYLSRIFKKQVGVSVIDYLINQRVEMAKKLLAGTNMRVSDVAVQVGYSNFSHFSKIFKKKVGVNPNQFKSLHMKE